MDRRKKMIIFLVIVIAAVIFIFARIISNSTIYLEWKIRYINENIKNLVIKDDLQWRTVAESVLKDAKGLDYRMYRDAYRSNFSQELDSQVSELLASSPVRFDEVYVVNQTWPMSGYPENSCVFRYTVVFNKGVYAWVDLVYVPSSNLQNPQWYQEYSRTPENILDDWYVIVLYGY